MTGFGVGGGGSCVHGGLCDAEGRVLLTLDGGIFDSVGFELTVEAPVQAGAGLLVGGVSGVRKSIQEVGCCNLPPCL